MPTTKFHNSKIIGAYVLQTTIVVMAALLVLLMVGNYRCKDMVACSITIFKTILIENLSNTSKVIRHKTYEYMVSSIRLYF